LIRNSAGEILFLEPVYKPTLEIPGGVAEYNESPLEACRREIREELGLDLEVGALLVADWVPAHGVWFDGLMFIFDGGVLSDEEISRIQLDPAESRRQVFLSLDRALPRLKPSLARRIAIRRSRPSSRNAGLRGVRPKRCPRLRRGQAAPSERWDF